MSNCAVIGTLNVSYWKCLWVFFILFFCLIYPRNYLETATSPGPVAFCHNDLQQGMMTNINKHLRQGMAVTV